MDEQSEAYKQEVTKHLTDTAKQSGIVFIGRLSGYLLAFVTQFILARYFGPRIFGHYSLIFSIIQIGTIFTIFGLDFGIIKYVSRYRVTSQWDKLKLIVKICIVYSTIFSVIGGSSLMLLRDILALRVFHDAALSPLFIWCGAAFLPYTLMMILCGLFRAYKILKYNSIGRWILRQLFFITVILILFLMGIKGSIPVIIALFVSYILLVIFLLYKTKNLNINLFRIIFEALKSSPELKTARNRLLKYSSTVIFIELTARLLSHTDKIMIGIYSTSGDVGIYNAAAQIALLTTFFLTATNMIFSSIISELHSKDNIRMLGELYSVITKWIIIFTFPLVVSMLIFPKTILGFFGDEYLISATVLIVLGIGRMITAAAGANGYILNLSGHEKLLLINNISLVALNIILNIVFIPKLGILGAAIATSVSLICINFLKLIEVKILLGIFPYNRNYYHIFLSIIAVVGLAFSAKFLYDNIITVAIVTVINVAVSIAISAIFKTELDGEIMAKVKRKFKRTLTG